MDFIAAHREQIVDFLVIGAAVLVALILREFIGPYLRRKAENLAAKQDTAVLTDESEKVLVGYNAHRQSQRIDADLRAALIEKRIAAHQGAIRMAHQLMRVIHGEEGEKVKALSAAQEWWLDNSLYLSPETRQAFSEAVNATQFHSLLLDSWRGRTGDSPEERDRVVREIKSNFAKIDDLRRSAEAAASLPPIHGRPPFQPDADSAAEDIR